MGKSSGSTRASSAGAPKGLSTASAPETRPTEEVEYKRSAEVEGLYRMAHDLYVKATTGSPSTRVFSRDAYNKAIGKAERAERKEQRDFYGTTEAAKVIRQEGVPALQETSTSIRGYRTISRPGYQLDDSDSRSISLAGVGKATYDKVVNALKEKGFTFNATEYGTASGYGGVGRITNIRKKRS